MHLVNPISEKMGFAFLLGKILEKTVRNGE